MQRLKHPISIFLGIGISLAPLWFAIRNIKWAETADAIRSLDLTLQSLTMSFLLAGLFLRAERWWIIISASNAFTFSVVLQTGSIAAILLAILGMFGYSFNRNNIPHIF